MECLLQRINTENIKQKSHLNEIRLEIRSIQILIDNILHEIENFEKSGVLNDKPVSQKVPVTKYFESTCDDTTEELYKNISKFLWTMIQFLDAQPNLQAHFALPAGIRGPKYHSLPTLCNMLWKRVVNIIKILNTENKTSIPNYAKNPEGDKMLSSSTQTEISCLLYCVSCNLSTELIKFLVNVILEEQNKYGVKMTNTSAFREKVRFEVFEISQCGAMKGWTEAIRKDIRWAVSVLASAQKHCAELRKERELIMEDHNRTFSAFKNDLDLTRSQLEAEQAQSAYLKQQIEDLEKSLTRRMKQEKIISRNVNQYKSKLKCLNESLQFIADDCKQLKTAQKSLQTFIKSIIMSKTRDISDVRNDITTLIKDIENSFTVKLQNEKEKQIRIQETSEERKSLIAELQTNITEHKEKRRKLNEKLKLLTDEKNLKEIEVKNALHKIMELEIKLEETKAREELNKSHMASLSETNWKFSGDPLRDMENQRQVNKQKIKVLLRENANLKTTIYKLKKIRTRCVDDSSSMVNTDGQL